MDEIKIALAGNPNVGKSTLFNQLTGLKQHVGNWPGKTVEKKEGSFKYKNYNFNVVDLPGNYSMTAYSIEEKVSRDYIAYENPDVIINVIDAANLERNLYLTIQMMEMGANIVLALNMNKFCDEKGLVINVDKLSKLLGIPVIKIEAIKKISDKDSGIEKLLENTISSFKSPVNVSDKLFYGEELREHIHQLEDEINNEISIGHAPNSWLALKLLEDDSDIIEKIESETNGKKIINESEKLKKHLNDIYNEDLDTVIADSRYGVISGIIKDSVKKPPLDRKTRSDRIDNIITNKYLGIPIFLAIMWLTFQITFTVGAPLQELVENIFVSLGQYVAAALGTSWLSSLIVDGIIGGVGSVLTFIPIIFLMFLVLSILEDCGYLARAAFVMDKFMNKFVGLQGKSFIPMILGFGCCVPAVMATRTLDNERDRILTMLIVPFMSCSARLPVYAIFTAAFFSAYQGWIVFSLYILGIIVAIISASILKKTYFKGDSSPFVMELPPYRLPTVKGSLIHMWERGSVFLKKAGTIIFAAAVIIWLLSSLPVGVETGSQASVLGQIGTAISPIFEPLGFGNWQASISLITGLLAKEVVVGTMGTLYGVGEEGLVAAVQGIFTPLSAYAFIVFVLLYIPCLAVIATIKRETNSWKWAGFSAVYTFAVAWIVSFIIYQGGLLLGFA